MFSLREYCAPDFTQEKFVSAPNATFERVLADGVAPMNYHAMSIYPEYIKIKGQWPCSTRGRIYRKKKVRSRVRI